MKIGTVSKIKLPVKESITSGVDSGQHGRVVNLNHVTIKTENCTAGICPRPQTWCLSSAEIYRIWWEWYRFCDAKYVVIGIVPSRIDKMPNTSVVQLPPG